MTDRPGPTRAALILRYAAAILIISALSALQMPYRYGSGNHVFQLPTVHRLLAPDLYPGDALVDSLRNYPSVAYPAVAWLAKALGVGVQPLYFALWLVERVCLVGMFLLIAARFVAGYWGRVFVTLVVSTTGWALLTTLIGGEHLFSAHLTHTDLAFALQLAALAAWLYRRPVVAAVVAAGALSLNAMTTVHFAAFLALVWLLGEDRWSRRYLWAALAFVLCALPFAAQARAAMGGASGAAGDTARFWELLSIRQGPHYFVNTMDIAALVSLAVVLALIVARRGADPWLRRMAIAGVVYVAAMLIVAPLGVQVWHSKLVVLFHPLRGDKWLFVTLVLAVPVFLWRQAAAETALATRALLPAIAGLFMLGPRPPLAVLVTLPMLLGVAVLQSTRKPATSREGTVLVITVAATMGAAYAALPDHRLLGAVLLLGGLAGVLIALRPRWTRALLLGAVGLVALGMVARNSMDLRAMRLDWYRADASRPWDEMARWADASTPASARFITPPYLEGWRCMSRRGTLVEYRDGSAMHWDVGFESGWWERLKALHCDVYYSEDELGPELAERYLALTPADLVAAADRYDIDYVIMPDTWQEPRGLVPVRSTRSYLAWAVADLRRAMSE